MDIILFMAVYVLLLYFGVYRNAKVFKFKLELIRQVHFILIDYLDSDVWETGHTEAEIKYIKMDAIGDSIYDISYIKMTLSFKPLTIENWLNEEQIDFLLHGNVVVDNDESNQTDVQYE